jgi:drug/metabolite transporter (DMT)-like permease
MRNILLCIGITALCFGGWPLIARSAGKTGVTGSLIMASLATIPIAIAVLYQGVQLPSVDSFKFLVFAGLVMGTGFIAYNVAITHPLSQVSITVPTISALMVVVTTMGGFFFFGEPLTKSKLMGAAFVIIGIVILRPDNQRRVETPPDASLPPPVTSSE